MMLETEVDGAGSVEANRPAPPAIWTRLRALAAGEPWLAAAFLAGVLVGWIGLGWWLLPIQWRNASPAVLNTDWQTQYVQLVAAAYARNPDDKQTAGALLTALEQPPAELAALLADAERRSLDPGLAADVHNLAAALTTGLTGTLVTSASQPAGGNPVPNAVQPSSGVGTSPPAADAGGLQRDLVWLVGLAMAGLIGLLLVRRISPAPVPSAEQAPALPPASNVPADGFTRGLALSRRRQASLQSWRLDIGDSVTTECDLSERFYQTWLLYDEQGGLVGSAGVQDKPVGQLGTLLIWLRAQFDDDERMAPPQLYIVSDEAFTDPVIRERLSDESSQVIPAEPGRMATLIAGPLLLEVEVRGVRPSANHTPRAVAVRMGLRRQGTPTVIPAAVAELEPPPRYRQD